jgi:hypothetical protein
VDNINSRDWFNPQILISWTLNVQDVSKSLLFLVMLKPLCNVLDVPLFCANQPEEKPDLLKVHLSEERLLNQ